MKHFSSVDRCSDEAAVVNPSRVISLEARPEDLGKVRGCLSETNRRHIQRREHQLLKSRPQGDACNFFNSVSNEQVTDIAVSPPLSGRKIEPIGNDSLEQTLAGPRSISPSDSFVVGLKSSIVRNAGPML
jgi:hypothetical protein